MAKCSFCGYDIPAGTGKMLVQKDGRVLYFDKKKCEKNMIKLGRKARVTEWTASYAAQKRADKHTAESAEGAEHAAGEAHD